MAKRNKHKKLSASGQSINYNMFDISRGKGGLPNTEVTVGATGALQKKGTKRGKRKREGQGAALQDAGAKSSAFDVPDAVADPQLG